MITKTMTNKQEIKYNCEGLIATWITKNSSKIQTGSILSLRTPNDEINVKTSQLSDELVKLIDRYKGSNVNIEFCIDGNAVESFNIN